MFVEDRVKIKNTIDSNGSERQRKIVYTANNKMGNAVYR
jgi:hypothetical protein